MDLVHSQVPETNTGRPLRAPGTGIEPATFWFRARCDYQQLLPRNVELNCRARVEGVEPSYHCFKGSWLTVSRHPNVDSQARVPCRSRTDLTGLEVQYLCRSVNGTSKQAEDRELTRKAFRSLRYEPDAVANRLALH